MVWAVGSGSKLISSRGRRGCKASFFLLPKSVEDVFGNESEICSTSNQLWSFSPGWWDLVKGIDVHKYNWSNGGKKSLSIKIDNMNIDKTGIRSFPRSKNYILISKRKSYYILFCFIPTICIASYDWHEYQPLVRSFSVSRSWLHSSRRN